MNQRKENNSDSFLENNLSIGLDELNEKLNSIEVIIISYFYGIEVEKLTVHEIAYRLELTAERIKILKERALLKLTK